MFSATNTRKYAQDLRKDVERVSKKGKVYQEKRAQVGKPSPDWNVPTGRIAPLTQLPYRPEHLYLQASFLP